MTALLLAVPSVGSQSLGAWRYDVFLSFKGETRLNFTDHLYAALLQRGITTFRDDEQLERGGPIGQMLDKAIEESRFCVIVFSPNYASSRWCLSELEKIYDCTKSKGLQTVLPVFYDVDPTHVKRQTGCFEKAFANHEAAYGKDSARVLKWRKALKEIANLSGWHLDKKPESVVIEEIVRKVFTEVHSELPSEYPSLVGMESRAGKLQEQLSRSSDDVLILGIPGMGGIGKTTITRVVYGRMFHEFDGCSFLANVREISKKRGIMSLQEQLLRDVLKDEKIRVPDVYRGVSMIKKGLCSRKVLLVLDDVVEIDQLAGLAGSCHWFGSGSRVIITTRDLHLLVEHGVGEFFYPEKLDNGEALNLFSQRAFKRYQPSELYLDLSNDVVKYAHGLPLALEVLGSFLVGRSTDEWKSTLKRLETMPMEKITDTLRITFDGLHEKEKKIFLDIACFFQGEDKDRAMKIWDGCGFDPDIGLRVLQDKFLVSVQEKELRMHDMLQQMGWEIVRQESPVKLGKRSRLWRPEDVRYVLENDKGSELIEGVIIKDEGKPSSGIFEGMDVDAKTFQKMNRLRLLKLQKVNLSGELEYLSSELRSLEWHNCKIESLPLGFHPNNLVDLRLYRSLIVKLYNGEKPLWKLKYLDLSHSRCLVSSPDFSLLPNLEEILFVGCVGLSQIHPSIGVLDKLIMLNLSGCKNLIRLPSSISGLGSLMYLDLFGCTKLVELPEAVGHLQCLEELDVGYMAIEELPSSFSRLKTLKGFSFSGCKGQKNRIWSSFVTSLFRRRDNSHRCGFPLTKLPNFCHLTNLDLSSCNISEYETPIDVSCLSSLMNLDLTGNNFTRVPLDISRLKRLKRLGLESCEKLEVLPKLPAKVQFVFANHCTSLKTLPDDIAYINCDFSFVNCHKLVGSSTSNSLVDKIFCLLLMCSKDRGVWRTHNFQIPGCKVPEWFTCRSTGATVTMQLDSDWYNDYFLGFAVCAVFKPSELANLLSYHELNYDLRVDGKQRHPSTSFLMSKSYGTIDSKHLWVSYVSRQAWDLSHGHLKGECHEVQLRFFGFSLSTEVTNCGICPLYGMGCEGGLDFTREIEKNRSASVALNVCPPYFYVPFLSDRNRTKQRKLIRNDSLGENEHPKRFKEL